VWNDNLACLKEIKNVLALTLARVDYHWMWAGTADMQIVIFNVNSFKEEKKISLKSEPVVVEKTRKLSFSTTPRGNAALEAAPEKDPSQKADPDVIGCITPSVGPHRSQVWVGTNSGIKRIDMKTDKVIDTILGGSTKTIHKIIPVNNELWRYQHK